jgi:putative transposase
MAHTFTDVFVHCIFSTKNRRDVIPSELQPEVWAYIHGIAKNLNVHTLAVGGTGNHSHVLLMLPPTINLSELVQKLKSNSSRWMGEQGIRFSWQQGFAAFSVSPSMLEKVKSYIWNQPEHHKKRSFEEEFTAYLRAMGIETPAMSAHE